MKAMACDNCGTVLPFDALNRQEDKNGEVAAWLVVVMGGDSYDLCTRECLIQFVSGDLFVAVHDESAAAVARIARTINEDRGGNDE